ncbi:hypothetical protein L7F22_032461 [Adiantum nelumboides]|nr:hypothetical protein [Adiantum nelumboides]
MVPTPHSQAWDYKGCADVASQVAEDEVRVEKVSKLLLTGRKEEGGVFNKLQFGVPLPVFFCKSIVVEDDANISIGKIEHDYVGVLNNDRISFERIAITCPRDGRVTSEANDINLVNNLDDKHDVQVVDKFEISEISRQEAY